MKRASVSLRIPERLYQAARRYAEAHDQTTYRVLNTAIEHGLTDLLTQGAPAGGAPCSEIADALAELDVKAERLARRLDRILHVASAAYAFSGAESVGFVENTAHTGGTLTLTNGANRLNLALFAQYTAAAFQLSGDGHGGTLITYAPAPAAAEGTLALTVAHHRGAAALQ